MKMARRSWPTLTCPWLKVLKPRNVAADLVRPLRTETQNEIGRPHEIEIAQAEAWLAICALSKSLDTEPETDPEIWSRAISRTEEWRNILT
jgi:hypothetical protein